MIKVGFYLMSEKGYRVLDSFLKCFGKQSIAYVVASRDSGLIKDYYSEILKLCQRHRIVFYDRSKALVTTTKTAVVFVVSWKWLIGSARHCGHLIILHDSLLPRYRGHTPIVTAMLHGDRHIGVTAFLANKAYDTGPILAQKKIVIQYPIKIAHVTTSIANLCSEIAIEISRKLLNGGFLKSVPQRKKGASYSLWRDEEDYRIRWSWSSKYIKRFIDTVGFPYLGAFAVVNQTKIRILDADIVKDEPIINRDPGKVFCIDHGYPVIVCGQGLLRARVLQHDRSRKSLLPWNKKRVRFL